MVRRRLFLATAIAAAITVACTTGVLLYQSEKHGRQNSATTPAAASPDYVEIAANVQKIDATARELVLRVLVIPHGKLSDGADTLIPAQNLQVESTSLVKGSYTFPAGDRIARQDMTIDLDGDVTDYPFDHYRGVAEFAAAMDGKPVPVSRAWTTPTRSSARARTLRLQTASPASP